MLRSEMKMRIRKGKGKLLLDSFKRDKNNNNNKYVNARNEEMIMEFMIIM